MCLVRVQKYDKVALPRSAPLYFVDCLIACGFSIPAHGDVLPSLPPIVQRGAPWAPARPVGLKQPLLPFPRAVQAIGRASGPNIAYEKVNEV